MKKFKEKILIGITGGIGSGKSEVCTQLANKGFKVFFADLMAKELYAKDKSLTSKLVKRFGKEILNFKGKINLSKFKQIIFSNKNNYLDANKIIHPAVIRYLDNEIKKCKEKVIFIESAIVYESGFDKYLDYVVLVYSNKENRIKRIMNRDGAKRKDVEQIMKYQLPEMEKVKRADFIINNNKSFDGLSKEIEAFSEILKFLK